ncbi:MAG: peptidoglycan DD-metalloendopeptidase family protein [Thermoleophilia bacterium]
MAQVEVPTAAGSSSGTAAAPPPPDAAPAPAPTAPAPTAATTAPKATPVVLRIGSYGAAVKDLQRELRRRGLKITVDGAFGPATKKAVKRMQKRFKLKQTGIADAKLLKKLGLQVRVTAGATAPVRPTVAPGKSPYLDVFPLVGDYTYSDDFGAARHQGRHEGNDIMADRNTPIVAVVNGTIERLTRTETGLGGIYVWLQRADGTEYYYAHMNSIAAGLQAGQQVSAGQVIGAVGNTGDARYGATHLHFEIRPGGSPIDPYPHLVAVDPTAR